SLTGILCLCSAVGCDVLRHLERFECFKIGDTDYHRGELAVTGHADPLPRVHCASDHVRAVIAQLSRGYLIWYLSHVSTGASMSTVYTTGFLSPWLLLRVDGIDLFYQGQHVVGSDEDVVLVVEGSVPADLTVVIGDARGDPLGGEFDTHGIVVGHRLDKAQVF